MSAVLNQGSLNLETRLKYSIPNYYSKNNCSAGQMLEAESYKKKFPRAIHRHGSASLHYNCHGLTFASRRTEISNSEALRKILVDDDYLQISRDTVLAGDIVLYVENDGDICHSGIVIHVPPSDAALINKLAGIVVLSKWGAAHEVIHEISECPYLNTQKEFHRVVK